MSLWVLGTDTGVGKTITSALILNRYGSQEKLAYWKPVSTGGDADRDRTTVAALLEPQIEVLPESYLLQMPVSPHLAARREGVEIEPGRILEDLQRHRAADPGRGILIEGAGGVLVPLTDRRDLLVDTVAATGLPVVLVARSTLGTINHTLLTLEALRSREVEVVGGLLFADLRFRGSGPRPGDSLPEFDLPTTEGTRVTKKEILAERPLMLVFGSYTCPMTASSIPSLKRLHAEFGDRVAMVMLNVREAHPGKHYPQPETIETKTEHARALKERYDMPWTVAVDDVDGTLHRAIDSKPNAAYLIDREGTIAFRSIWARDERSLRRALASVASGEAPARRESRAMIGMVTRAAGSVHEVMRRAGPPAERQHLIANPPLETAALVAPLLRPIIRDPDRRGIAAVVILSALVAAVIGVAIGVALAV